MHAYRKELILKSAYVYFLISDIGGWVSREKMDLDMDQRLSETEPVMRRRGLRWDSP